MILISQLDFINANKPHWNHSIVPRKKINLPRAELNARGTALILIGKKCQINTNARAACLPIVGRNLHRNKLDAKFPSANSVWQKAALWSFDKVAPIDWLADTHIHTCELFCIMNRCARRLWSILGRARTRTGAHLVHARIIKLANTPRTHTPPSIKLRPDYAWRASADFWLGWLKKYIFYFGCGLFSRCALFLSNSFGDWLFYCWLNCKAKFGAWCAPENAEVSVCVCWVIHPRSNTSTNTYRLASLSKKTEQKTVPISRQLLSADFESASDSDPLSRRLNLNRSRLLRRRIGDDGLKMSVIWIHALMAGLLLFLYF